MIFAPKDAKKNRQICALQSDNHSTSDYWILLQETKRSHEVILSKQRNGEQRQETITIPRGQFLRLVAWYLKPQKTRKR